MPQFLPGLQLSRMFFHEAVKPILDRTHPGLVYSAALIGYGSDVLGYDTPISTDHQWGPRLLLFLSAHDRVELRDDIVTTLGRELPRRFCGFSTHFGLPDHEGIRQMQGPSSGPVNHLVTVWTTRDILQHTLGVGSYTGLTMRDWLTFPEQRLLELTSGRVFHDGLGEIEEMRTHFRYHPPDVWLYRMMAAWARIAQEEAFVGRTGDVGDELGSAVVASRHVRDLMRLCFLLERRYAPYSKWLGTAFSKLACAHTLQPLFQGVFRSGTWREREEYLSNAFETVARIHNGLDLTPPLPTRVSRYFARPYMVIHADRFVSALRQLIADEDLRSFPFDIGAVDQWTDSTDVLTNVDLLQRARELYRQR